MKSQPLYPLTPTQRRTPLASMVTWLTKTRLVCAIAFLSLLAVQGLTDPDYFWHLRTGEYIVSNRALPAGDVFSWSAFGQKWILHEWLFEVVLYGVFALAGTLGVKAMTAAIGMLAIGVVATAASRITRHAAAAGIAACAAFAAFSSGISPRPQLFTFLFLAIYLAKLLDFKYNGKLPARWLLPAIMIVWVNMHGGYVIGVALLLLFVFCEWLALRWDVSPARSARGSQWKQLALIAGLTVLATLANPWFIAHWLYPFQVIGMSATAFISEWQSPDFHATMAQAFLVLTAILISAWLCADRRPDLTEILIPAFFCLQAFVSQRHMPIAALVAVPFLAVALREGALARITTLWNDTWIGQAYARRYRSGSDLGDREFVMNWAVLAVFATLLGVMAPKFEEAEQRRLERILPVKAADFVIANGIQGRMFNDYTYGGYLVYRLAPAIKVYIDGRADLYGDAFVADYVEINHGKADWKQKLAKLDVNFAIVGIDAPIRQLLIAENSFREVYADENHVVLVRNRTATNAAR